jgi:hypothetical protein
MIEYCGHQAVFHDDHVDYLVGHHLHYVNNAGSCENHGHLRVLSRDTLSARDKREWLMLAASDLVNLQ